MKVLSTVVDQAGDTRFELTGGYYAFNNGDIFTPKGKPVKPESVRYKRLMVAVEVFKKIAAHKEKA